MLDEESRAAEEIAKATGKGIDLVRDAGGFVEDIFGESFRQFGAAATDWARYYRFKNWLYVIDKVRTIMESRQQVGKLVPIPPQFALPLFDGISLEAEEEVQQLWAGLIANAVDPSYTIRIKKVYLEILRGLEPLDALILSLLADPNLDDRYSFTSEQTLNAEELSFHVQVDVEEAKISLQTLARYSCVIDSWENTLESLDRGYGGFRVNNPKSNFRLSHLGTQLVEATSSVHGDVTDPDHT